MSALLTPIRVEAGFWLILWLGLATGIGLETDWGRQLQLPVTEISEIPPEFPRPVLAEPFRLPAPDEFRDITARPLFIATRRSAPIAPPPEPPKPSMVKGQFILLGTTIVPEGKFAFLLEKAGNRSRVVAEGKEISGIIVKEVTTERVVLSQYEDTEVLVLRSIKPPAGPQVRSPAAPGPAPRPQPQPKPRPQAPAGSAIGPR